MKLCLPCGGAGPKGLTSLRTGSLVVERLKQELCVGRQLAPSTILALPLIKITGKVINQPVHTIRLIHREE